jgi:hypothetical protein
LHVVLVGHSAVDGDRDVGDVTPLSVNVTGGSDE